MTLAHVYKQTLATVAACLLSVCGGLTFGITAVMLPKLKEDESFPYDEQFDSWIASISALAMIFSCVFAGSVLDKLGRKYSFILGSIPFVIGWSCIAIANDNTLIFIGRFLTGVSTGAIRPISLVYIGETAEPKNRLTFLFLPTLCTHLGALLSHIIGEYFYWKTSCILCLIPAVISMVTFTYLKESPLWLISKSRIYEGVEAFKWFRGEDEEARNELNSVLEAQKEKSNEMNLKEIKKLLLSGTFIKILLALIFLTLAIQACGVNVLSFYALKIFNKTFSGKLDTYILLIAADIIRTLEAIGLCVFVKFLPKKKFTFMFCATVASVSLVMLCILICLDNDDLLWGLVTFLILYVAFASALVTVGWSFIPEILPNTYRGLGSSLSSCAGYILLFIAVKIIPDILDMYGELAMYISFAIGIFICSVILWFVLPETSGKTLQAIENNNYNTDNDNNTKL